QQAIDKAEHYLQIKSFERALNHLKASSPSNLWERNKLRISYFKGGELAYASKQLAHAISFFEAAKELSHTPEEITEADKRIYFSLFLHFQMEGKKLLSQGNRELGIKFLKNASSAYDRYPKNPKIKDKARAFMQAQMLQIRKILSEEGEISYPDFPEETTESSPIESKPQPIKAPEVYVFAGEMEERVAFKLAISSGLELYRENRFDLALKEFEKALQIRETDQVVSIIAKCKLGLSLVEELDKCYGKTA
ncbi:MAG: hypothetical protein AAFR87_16745, partial [Bacteroidota bacterium]